MPQHEPAEAPSTTTPYCTSNKHIPSFSIFLYNTTVVSYKADLEVIDPFACSSQCDHGE